MRWPDTEIDDLVMALNEAATNVVEHAYTGRFAASPRQRQVLAEIVLDPDEGRMCG